MTTSLDIPNSALIGGYLDFVARVEDERSYSPHEAGDKAWQASLYVGQGCTLAATEPDLAASAFERAQQILGPRPDKLTFRNYPDALVHRLAGMLALQGAAEETMHWHPSLHGDVVTALDAAQRRAHTLAQIEQTDDESLLNQKHRIASKVAELTALGLVGRHPWILSAPALSHHDRGLKQASNFDQVIIETSPGREPQAHKIQTKSFCLGFCGKPGTKERLKYATDIILVSGECDLGIQHKKRNDWRFPIGDLLIKEAAGETTPTETLKLDAAMNALLLKVTADPSRRGRHIRDNTMATRRVRRALDRAALPI